MSGEKVSLCGFRSRGPNKKKIGSPSKKKKIQKNALEDPLEEGKEKEKDDFPKLKTYLSGM